MSPATPNSKSSRRTPRRLYRRPVGILVGGRYEVPFGIQLSEGGLLIDTVDASGRERFTADELGVGQRLTVTMILPTGSSMVLRGSVIYHEDSGSARPSGRANANNVAASANGTAIAIKFDSVPLTQRREIRNYVSSKPVNEA